MSGYLLIEIRKGFYLDSVALMRLSREIAAMDGITEAALMMGSPSNIAILRDAGLLSEEVSATGNDLVLALRARTESAGRQALDAARQALDRPRGSTADGDQGWRPRSIAAAVRETPGANLALVSVPGEYAAAEARKALHRGLNVLVFSDNVPLDEEVSLKREARELGLLVMGPDCGTAVINGAPLAFANRLRRGPIGIIGASGTGMQEVSSLISEAGGGVSHAIGVGSRDLTAQVGAITTLMAIDALDDDQATESVVLISKPPHPQVAERVVERIGRSAKPYTVCFIGAESIALPGNARQAHTLREAAALALGGTLSGFGFDVTGIAAAHRAAVPAGGRIEGLFCGGTLCAEAQYLLIAGGRRVASNVPVPGAGKADPGADPADDRLLDLGADEYTRGRPHPMIDSTLRDELLGNALADARIAVILLDLVIGFGAHPDPASSIADIVGRSPAAGPIVVASVTGTALDPQDRTVQSGRLADAGVLVAPSNAQAAELALALAAQSG